MRSLVFYRSSYLLEWPFPSMRRVAVALSIVFAAPIGFSSDAHCAEFRGLGDLAGGGFFSQAFAVSADGSTIVGTSEVEREVLSNGYVDRRYEAFRWTEERGLEALGQTSFYWFQGRGDVSADGSTALVLDANATDEIYLRVVGPENESTFVRGANLGLGVLSADGSTVAGGLDYSDPAWTWSAADGLSNLPVFDEPVEDPFYHPRGLSADGAFVFGNARFDWEDQGVVWDRDAGSIALIASFLDGVERTIFTALSADGATAVARIGGWSSDEFVLWDVESGLGSARRVSPGWTRAPVAISAAGDRAVLSNGEVWSATTGSLPMEALLSIAGLDIGDWTIDEVVGISADGLTFTGTGTNPNGDSEAWIAVIPEPGPALLIGLGLAGLAVCRERRCRM